ncbi:MAG: hypothetical protein K2Z25_08160 [Beijerinckiaceae bacterium]|nr:hypothetical protein [Beijerinckiaceae bacterium]
MTKPTIRIAVAAAALATAGAAFANTPVEGDAIKQLVSGKRIYLAAPIGGEFPLFYRPDGQVDGSGEAIGLGRFLKPKDKGRWWVRGNNLCQKWETWYDGKTICFTLTDLGGSKVKWVQDNGDTGVARIGN